MHLADTCLFYKLALLPQACEAEYKQVSSVKPSVMLMGVALVLGLVLTALTGLYSRTTTGQYCSRDPELNARIDCSLHVNNRGLPLAYEISPDYQPKHGHQVLPLIADTVLWSTVSGLILVALKKVRT